jgi:hypothetical protein
MLHSPLPKTWYSLSSPLSLGMNESRYSAVLRREWLAAGKLLMRMRRRRRRRQAHNVPMRLSERNVSTEYRDCAHDSTNTHYRLLPCFVVVVRHFSFVLLALCMSVHLYLSVPLTSSLSVSIFCLSLSPCLSLSTCLSLPTILSACLSVSLRQSSLSLCLCLSLVYLSLCVSII